MDEIVQGGYRSADTEHHWPTAFAFNISHAHCRDDIEGAAESLVPGRVKGQSLDLMEISHGTPLQGHGFWVEGQRSESGVFTMVVCVCGGQ